MRVPSLWILSPHAWAAAVAMLRAGGVTCCVCVCMNACGGDEGMLPSASSLISISAPGTPLPSALSIDSAASGNPVGLRVALSANGDGFAVWSASDGTRRNLWANRYHAAAAAWGSPVNIEASGSDIDDFDLAADGSGNAVVAWHEVPRVEPVPTDNAGTVKGARFDAGTGAWGVPVLLTTNARDPRVAGNAAGAVLVVYVFGSHLVRGRFFDPVGGAWQPEAAIEQNHTGTGFSSGPAAWLDGGGNALAVWRYARIGVATAASNHFSGRAGGWAQLAPDDPGSLGGVPGSFIHGSLLDLQVTASTDGNFLAAWAAIEERSAPQSDHAKILLTRFTSRTRTWGAVQTLVPNRGQNIQLQRMGSDAAGKALVLWTEDVGARTALKALRVDDAGAACSAVPVIDAAVGGGAAHADLGVDAQGHAIAIWQQFEGGRADDGSRSNIATSRFDGAAGAWAGAVLAETQPGNASRPRASASGGRALLAWIQAEDGANHVKALLQPL